MLSPEEKREIVDAFYDAWLKHSRQRFGQLFANMTGHHRDPFHVQDQELQYALDLSEDIPANWIERIVEE
jgi:hypothetical protein